MASSRGRNRDGKAAERAKQAIDLRKAGASYDTIARTLHYSDRAVAYNAVQRELTRTLQEPAADLRKLEVARLDDLYAALAPKALVGDAGAVDRCLRIMERRAALLGLDMPRADADALALLNVRRVYERR